MPESRSHEAPAPPGLGTSGPRTSKTRIGRPSPAMPRQAEALPASELRSLLGIASTGLARKDRPPRFIASRETDRGRGIDGGQPTHPGSRWLGRPSQSLRARPPEAAADGFPAVVRPTNSHWWAAFMKYLWPSGRGATFASLTAFLGIPHDTGTKSLAHVGVHP